MKPVFESKNTTFSYQGKDNEKGRKQTVRNLKETATDDEILTLGEIYQTLAPNDEPMIQVAVTQKHHYDL